MPMPFPIVSLPLLCLLCKACRNNLRTVSGLFAVGILLNHIILAVMLEKKLSTSVQPLTIISAQLHRQSGTGVLIFCYQSINLSKSTGTSQQSEQSLISASVTTFKCPSKQACKEYFPYFSVPVPALVSVHSQCLLGFPGSPAWETESQALRKP